MLEWKWDKQKKRQYGGWGRWGWGTTWVHTMDEKRIDFHTLRTWLENNIPHLFGNVGCTLYWKYSTWATLARRQIPLFMKTAGRTGRSHKLLVTDCMSISECLSPSILNYLTCVYVCFVQYKTSIWCICVYVYICVCMCVCVCVRGWRAGFCCLSFSFYFSIFAQRLTIA